MKVHHTLICFFLFLSLQDGNTGLVNAQIPVYSRTEGEDVRVQCSFSFLGSRMYFCKGTCRENIIFDRFVRGQRGRYSIEFKRTSRGEDVFVTIRNLTKSDSGLYRCRLTGQRNDEYHQIRIIVVDAVLQRNPPEGRTLYTRTGGDIVVHCFFTSVRLEAGSGTYFCRDDCREEKDILVQTSGRRVQNGSYSVELLKADTSGFVFVSITQLNHSDSGRYRCALDRPLSPDLYRDFNIMVTDGQVLISQTPPVPSVATPATTAQSFSSDEQETERTQTTDAILYTVVSLVIGVIISGLLLMIICIRRKSKPEGLITRGNADDTNMEMPDYENYPPPPVFSSDNVTYLTAHPATRDLNQIYSTLTNTQHT